MFSKALSRASLRFTVRNTVRHRRCSSHSGSPVSNGALTVSVSDARPNATSQFQAWFGSETAGALHRMGIIEPNSVQSNAIPLALSGCDVMVVSQTGSGKTLMFLLPLLHRLCQASVVGLNSDVIDVPSAALPEALVLTPTSDLSLQVAAVGKKLVKSLDPPVAVECMIGQGSSPSRHARLLVSTPEHALQGIRDGRIRVDRLQAVAIDEADSIFCQRPAMAAEADKLLELLDSHCGPLQMTLTMAHVSDSAEKQLVERFPTVQRVGHTGVLVPTLRQRYHYFRGDRDAKLLKIFENASCDPWLREGTALVFCASGQEAEDVQLLLFTQANEDWRPACAALHEGTPQHSRAAALAEFRTAAARVLVTTDASARGLDLPNLRHVVMYDMPTDLTTFVHCAGRTARRGHQGVVTCLVRTGSGGAGQFGYTGHHALPPAQQLSFKAVEGEKRSQPRGEESQQ